MKSVRTVAARFRRPAERGTTLIELLISMLVLAVGFGGLFGLIATTMSSNNRNSKDSASSLLAQMVIEQISSQHPNSTTTISVIDCASNTWTIATAGGAAPSGTGAALATSSSSTSYGGIDPAQAVTAIPAGYKMQYVDCSTNGPTTYDVRWNVMTVDGNYTRLVTASARPIAASSTHLGSRMFALPVNLRTIAGP